MGRMAELHAELEAAREPCEDDWVWATLVCEQKFTEPTVVIVCVTDRFGSPVQAELTVAEAVELRTLIGRAVAEAMERGD